MSIKDQLNHMKQADIASLFGRDVKTIQRWHDEGLPRHGEGRGTTYVWADVLRWYEARLSQSKAPDDKDRKLRAEADLAEMDRDLQAGKLMDTAQAQASWGNFLSGLQSNLMGFPDRVAPDLDDGMTLAERREVLRRAMIASLQGVVTEAERNAAEVTG